MKGFRLTAILLGSIGVVVTSGMVLNACDSGGGGNAAADQARIFYTGPDLTSKTLSNARAYIPSQCYTKTQDDDGSVHNPCYSCHVDSANPNFLNDQDLQTAYSFATPALENAWANLFEDRAARVAAISNQQILDYIAVENYLADDGTPILAAKLANPPIEWDSNQDGTWSGFIPDCYFNFDAQGFDRDLNANFTGWRAFGYYPFLGTFWPTNGATDDVLIRLGEPLRQNEDGEFDLAVYKLNFAIVQALITRQDVTIDPVDENLYGVDLNKDGNLGNANLIKFDWAPLEGRDMSYVGRARLLQQAGSLKLAAGLFPVGTEFLHSVRYIQPTEDGGVELAARMKELRYAKKTTWNTYAALKDKALNEIRERDAFPDRLRSIIGDLEHGVSNGQGWRYAAFIEDANGDLRPQTYEELVFCVGCHGGVGATSDTIFSFPRKFNAQAFQQGWYHWSQQGLDGVPEPVRADGEFEYSFYLQKNGAGDEFRANEEVIAKFFDAQGNLDQAEIALLHNDVTELLSPSVERALTLNKAYRVIVQDQDFIKGRDATVTPPANVHRSVELNQATGVVTPVAGPNTP